MNTPKEYSKEIPFKLYFLEMNIFFEVTSFLRNFHLIEFS